MTQMVINQAEIVTSFTEMHLQTQEYRERLKNAKVASQSIKAELGVILGRCDSSRSEIQRLENKIELLNEQIGHDNDQLTNLHREKDSLTQQSTELKNEIKRIGPGEVAKRLKKERARHLVRIEDKELAINDITPRLQKAKQDIQQAEQALVEAQDRYRAVYYELDQMQMKLPSPYLFTELYYSAVAENNSQFHIEQDVELWRREFLASINLIKELHLDIRSGKYRLDKYSDLVGGRADATVLSLYGSVLLNKVDLCNELFRLATDAELYFHHIFNVFRTWMLGLYISGEIKTLKELIRYHRYSGGLRTAYCEVFESFIDGSSLKFQRGINNVIHEEWLITKKTDLPRGISYVCIPALSFCAIAKQRKLKFNISSPTVPLALIPKGLKLHAA